MEREQVAALIGILQGAPMTVLVAMAFENRPVGLEPLTRLTRYTRKTVRAALEELATCGLVVQLSRYESWQLTRGAMQLPLTFDLPQIEAPDVDRAMDVMQVRRTLPNPGGVKITPPADSSSVVVITQGREMTTPEQHNPGGVKITPPANGKVPVSAVLALVELGNARRRSEHAVAGATERGESEASILAKIAEGVAYCNSAAAASLTAPGAFILVCIEDGRPFASAAFADRHGASPPAGGPRGAKEQRNADQREQHARQLRELDEQQNSGNVGYSGKPTGACRTDVITSRDHPTGADKKGSTE